MNVDLAKFPHLLPLIEDGTLAPVPPNYEVEEDGVGGIQFINKETGESSNTHPLDVYYKQELERYKLMSVEEAKRELENRDAQMDNLEDLVLMSDDDQSIIDPDEDDILDCAELMKINIIDEPFLRETIRKSLMKPMPKEWKTY